MAIADTPDSRQSERIKLKKEGWTLSRTTHLPRTPPAYPSPEPLSALLDAAHGNIYESRLTAFYEQTQLP